MKATRQYAAGAGLMLIAATGAAQADQQFFDDVIITQSLCVGQDCANGESFGFDTIRLKENNLRIKAQDTSNSASFPTSDWQITFNDSSNGGTNKFSIDDIDGGRTPFTIEAGAATNALYVEADSDIGIGTKDPVVELHIKDGDSPTLRLEQDGSAGFTAQTWDVAGNEAGFFVRDVTNGSQLAFRIRPGAKASTIDMNANERIGLGVETPMAALHLRRTGAAITAAETADMLIEGANGDTKLTVQENNASILARELFSMKNNGGSYFTLENTSTGASWFFTHENSAPNRFIINSSVAPNDGMFLESGGNMTIGGTLTENSDKNAKMAIEPVDTAEILEKVAALPVSEWSYIDTAGVRHIGPMAQDFYALFGTGASETGISTLDTSGVALAAIQALAAQNAAQQDVIETLLTRIDRLENAAR